ncbi:MAG: peptide-methionine (S)-S-oxide reductase [Rhodospirillaceae bacterium]|nr:peptide-methionine (S)-S-oxide reductase [Rhodospirillaceae bacterium]|tara:strand:+ start:15656 stop:16306 length:651 start_codon:yes stop_codon:yes gene_type:complete
MWFSPRKLEVPSAEDALPGRDTALQVSDKHIANGNPLKPPFPDGMEQIVFALGCFWGAERIFWQTPGVFTTAVGYIAGHTKNPTYEEVCSGRTGHTEAVLVVFDPKEVSVEALLKVFWEGHDPTQGMRQGNDVGTQYRSGIYVYSAEQRAAVEKSFQMFGEALMAAGHGGITSEIKDAPEFYYAEDYHQQYLAKNPAGYCGLGGTGVTCPMPAAAE